MHTLIIIVKQMFFFHLSDIYKLQKRNTEVYPWQAEL